MASDRGFVMTKEFDALSEAARSIQNKVGEQNLWKAVMALHAWCFVAQGEGDEAEPMIVSIKGTPMLLAFTDQDRAEAFTGHLQEKNPGPRAGLLEMDAADAVSYVLELEVVGVGNILFNYGDHSFSCTMTSLADMHGRYAAGR